MDEAEFLSLAEDLLGRLEEEIERAAEAAGVDIDLEPQEGGILKLEFDNRSQIIINRHAAAREIWVAARAGGFHFRYEAGAWINGRDGSELFASLSRLLSEQAGALVSLGR